LISFHAVAPLWEANLNALEKLVRVKESVVAVAAVAESMPEEGNEDADSANKDDEVNTIKEDVYPATKDDTVDAITQGSTEKGMLFVLVSPPNRSSPRAGKSLTKSVHSYDSPQQVSSCTI